MPSDSIELSEPLNCCNLQLQDGLSCPVGCNELLIMVFLLLDGKDPRMRFIPERSACFFMGT